MTMLAFLPETIIDTILDQAMSPSVIKLWICGDRTLQHKISTGITKIKLVDHRTLTTGRFPKFIEELRSLRELTIDRDCRPMPYYRDIPQHIRCLPPTLKKLKIRVLESYQIIYPHTPTTARISSYEAGHPIDSDVMHPSWTFSSAFPQLETLYVHFYNKWKETDFALLPPSLTSLTVSLCETPLEEDFTLSLPRQLLSLKVHRLLLIRPSFWRGLPPHLTKIYVGTVIRYLAVMRLPSLTQLNGGLIGCFQLPDLPPTLTSLNIRWLRATFNYAELASFPHLKKFSTGELTADMLRSLPLSCLQTINTATFSLTKEDIEQFWPVKLCSLSAGRCVIFPSLYTPPSGLTALTITKKVDMALVASFPPTLRTLILDKAHSDDDNSIVFPPHLTHLSLLKGRVLGDDWGWATFKEPFQWAQSAHQARNGFASAEPSLSLNGKTVLQCFPYHKLPRSLRYLTLAAAIPASELKNLPRALTHLEVYEIFEDAAFLADHELYMPSMPSLPLTNTVGGHSGDSSVSTHLKRGSIPALLPRSMTSFQLWGNAMAEAGTNWSMMPPHFVSFTCEPPNGLPVNFLEYMPMKSLKSLRVVLHGVEDSHLKLIPRHLQRGRVQLINSPNLTLAALHCIPTLEFIHHGEPVDLMRCELSKHELDEDPSIFLRLMRSDHDLLNHL